MRGPMAQRKRGRERNYRCWIDAEAERWPAVAGRRARRQGRRGEAEIREVLSRALVEEIRGEKEPEKEGEDRDSGEEISVNKNHGTGTLEPGRSGLPRFLIPKKIKRKKRELFDIFLHILLYP